MLKEYVVVDIDNTLIDTERRGLLVGRNFCVKIHCAVSNDGLNTCDLAGRLVMLTWRRRVVPLA